MVLGALARRPWPARAPSRRPAAPAPDSQRLLRALRTRFVSVADRATPSVVNVSVKVKREARPESGASPEMEERFREFFGPELFERFFRRQAPRDEGRAAGSGVMVDPRGYILTNNHVVENATEIEVRLSDDRKFKAALVGRDGRTDLACSRSRTRGATAGPTWATRTAAGGAVGHRHRQSLGLDRTVTVGSLGDRPHPRGRGTTEALIQTDASINPGTPGPIAELDGPRGGINTATSPAGRASASRSRSTWRATL